MKLLYVTSTLPYGRQEAFIIPEIAELLRTGHDVTVVPMKPRGAVVHDDALPLLPRTLSASVLSAGIVAGAVAEAVSFPGRTAKACRLLLHSRSPRILLKNTAVFTKGVWLGRQARLADVEHIHAHWASGPSTMAFVAATVSGIPWSFTAHRWDIRENNLLKTKVGAACFVRAISAKGASQIRVHTRSASNVTVIHMGIECTDASTSVPSPGVGRPFPIVMVADFVPVKGHDLLVDAAVLLRQRGVDVRVDLVGDGPTRRSVERQLRERDMDSWVKVCGTMPHAALLRALGSQRWDAVVLPSVVLEDSEEGIPVSLVEAMGVGVPVVSTRSGAISELLADGAGVMVDAADAVALADAVEVLARNPSTRRELSGAGRQRVRTDFNVATTTAALVARFKRCQRSR